MIIFQNTVKQLGKSL